MERWFEITILANTVAAFPGLTFELLPDWCWKALDLNALVWESLCPGQALKHRRALLTKPRSKEQCETTRVYLSTWGGT